MKRLIARSMVMVLLLNVGLLMGVAQESEADEPTLLIYSTVSQLLSGDVTVGIDIPLMQEQLDAFATDWSVVGIGTTTQPERNGELMPDGTVEHVYYWWVDPSSPDQNAVIELGKMLELMEATPVPGATPSPDSFEPEFPFIGLAVADPDAALTFELTEVENLHDWIAATLADAGVTTAGLQITGDFGAVSTTIGYNLPTTGVDTSGVYASTEYFHFLDYEPATWTMNGLYTADADLEPVISTPGRPVHLHGYQPENMIGGHIASAAVENATLTVYPLANVVQLREDAATEDAAEAA